MIPKSSATDNATRTRRRKFTLISGDESARTMPDVRGQSTPTAAHRYAQRGMYVLPVAEGKHPGSIVGKGWPHKSTIDTAEVKRLWEAHPDAGIAVHAGPSGLLFFDIDIDVIPEELSWLKTGIIQYSRADSVKSERGHYGFFTGDEIFVSCELKLSDGTKVGDIRSGNSVIISSPSPHVHADTRNGEYHWRASDINRPIPKLPKEARKYLSRIGTRRSGGGTTSDGFSVEASSTEVKTALRDWTGDDAPHKLDALVQWIANSDDATRNPTRDALRIAASESRIGLYPLARAVDGLRKAMIASYALRGESDRFSEDEFARLVANGVGYALSRHPAEIEAETDRNEADDVDDHEPVTRSLADVTRTRVKWLWRPWLPKAKVSILEGEPDVGKSLVTLMWAALVSTGRSWPAAIVDGASVRTPKSVPAGVVLVGIEDDESDTIVPRLDAARADRSRIAVLRQPVDRGGQPRPFVLPDGIRRLRRAIVEVNAALVVIDPITAFLSTRSVKAGDDSSTRQALMPLAELARDTGAAIVLVRHHNKAAGMSAKNRGSGTVAYGGLARSVIVASEIKDDDVTALGGPTHALALVKGNLTPNPMTLGYRLETTRSDPDSPVVQWSGEVDLTADQLVGADGARVSDGRRNAPVRDECEELLRILLADGPEKQDLVIKKVREGVGCSDKPVRVAAQKAGVVKRRVYIDGKIDHWTWELPAVKTIVRRPPSKSIGGQQR